MALILDYRDKGLSLEKIDPLSTSMLYIYAACFSFSYVNPSVATGTLHLFSTVQLTMAGFALAKGQHPGLQTWAGIITALGGVPWSVNQ